jgi:hypothetical protein
MNTIDPFECNSYSDFINEAYDCLSIYKYQSEIKKGNEDYETDMSMYEMMLRHAGILACISIELAANNLLYNVIGKEMGTYEKLDPIAKYELIAAIKHKKIIKSDKRYDNAKELYSVRNAFAHPSPEKTGVTKNSQIPRVILHVKYDDAVRLIGHSVGFVSWYLFDLLKLKSKTAIPLISYHHFGLNGSAMEYEHYNGHDIRCLRYGRESEIKALRRLRGRA